MRGSSLLLWQVQVLALVQCPAAWRHRQVTWRPVFHSRQSTVSRPGRIVFWNLELLLLPAHLPYSWTPLEKAVGLDFRCHRRRKRAASEFHGAKSSGILPEVRRRSVIIVLLNLVSPLAVGRPEPFSFTTGEIDWAPGWRNVEVSCELASLLVAWRCVRRWHADNAAAMWTLDSSDRYMDAPMSSLLYVNSTVV